MKEFKIKKLEHNLYKITEKKGEFIMTVNSDEAYIILSTLYASLNKNSVIKFDKTSPQTIGFTIEQAKNFAKNNDSITFANSEG